MMVSPRWIPRPTPNLAPSVSTCSIRLDRVEPYAVDRAGHAGLEADRVALGLVRGRERVPRQDPCGVGDAGVGDQRLLAADRDAPQAAVHRVGRAEGWHGQLALLQVLELLGSLEGTIADGCQDLELRRERAQCDFEADLVVAGRGRPVRDDVRVELARELGDGLGLEHALRADAQRIEIAATHVAHDEVLEHLLEVCGPRVDEVMGDGAERPRALLEHAGRFGVDAAGVHGERDDRAAVRLGEPRHTEGRVESAGKSEQDGPGALGRRHGEFLSVRNGCEGARAAGAGRGRSPSQ